MMNLTVAAMIAIATANGMTCTAEQAGFYSQTMAVVDIQTVDDTEEITAMDFNGNEWSWYDDCGDWFVGDLASVTLCNNGTEIIYDDIIVNARYSGWTEWFGYDTESGEPLVIFD